MARKNLIISFLSSVPESIRAQLKDETIFAPCPVTQAGGGGYSGGRDGYREWLAKFRDGSGNVIPGIARSHGLGGGDSIGKVCAMGFSNGCIGVDELLGSNDAQRIDAVFAVDGIHGMYGANGLPVAAQYKRYMNQAAHVAQFNAEADRNAPVMVISHSSIGPILNPDRSKKSPSTTETAEVIWNVVHPMIPSNYVPAQTGWGSAPWLHLESIRSRYADPVEKCSGNGCFTWYGIEDGWYDKRGANNFYVLGWGYPLAGKVSTKDPAGYADHVFQGQVVLHALLSEFVVQRWNTNCGQVATAGLGGEPGACILPAGVNYETAAVQKIDYFPDLNDTSPLPNPCPLPPLGRKIVGSPTDPCALDEPLKEPPAPPAAGDSDSKKWLAAAAGFAVGYGLAWYGGRLYRTR